MKSFYVILIVLFMYSCNGRIDFGDKDHKSQDTVKRAAVDSDMQDYVASADSILKNVEEDVIIINEGYDPEFLKKVEWRGWMLGKPADYFLNNTKDFDTLQVAYPKMDCEFYIIPDYYCSEKRKNDTVALRIFKFNIPGNRQFKIYHLYRFGNGHYIDIATYFFIDDRQIKEYCIYYSHFGTYNPKICTFECSTMETTSVMISKDNKYLIIKPSSFEPATGMRIFDLRPYGYKMVMLPPSSFAE